MEIWIVSLALPRPVQGQNLLRCKDKTTQYQNRPKPLYTKRNAVSTLVEVVNAASDYSGGEELADNPAHVDECSEVRSQYDWSYF